jgi:hypothetical protein
MTDAMKTGGQHYSRKRRMTIERSDFLGFLSVDRNSLTNDLKILS